MYEKVTSKQWFAIKKLPANFYYFSCFAGILSAEKPTHHKKTEIYPPMNNCVYVTSRVVSQRYCNARSPRARTYNECSSRELGNYRHFLCQTESFFAALFCMKLPAFGTRAEAGRFAERYPTIGCSQSSLMGAIQSNRKPSYDANGEGNLCFVKY